MRCCGSLGEQEKPFDSRKLSTVLSTGTSGIQFTLTWMHGSVAGPQALGADQDLRSPYGRQQRREHAP